MQGAAAGKHGDVIDEEEKIVNGNDCKGIQIAFVQIKV